MRLVCVGSLAARYKGVDVLLRAIADAKGRGVGLRLDVVGGGQHQEELEELAARLGIGDVSHFLGQIPSGTDVRSHLLAADVFVLPSRTEGLPSALVEAMAVSLPCVASRVGGIGELLQPEFTPPPGDSRRLADALVRLADDPDVRARAASDNYAYAQRFREGALREKREEFFTRLEERWVGAR